MATIDVFNLKREKVGTVDLSDEVFGTEVREHLFYEVVKAQLASRRQGTQCAKNRSAVSGSTKKMYKQKGTGNARHGSKRAPVYVGGGRAHPPRPRDWSYRPPAQVRKLALTSALSKFHKEGRIVIVDNFQLKEIKTKIFMSTLDALKAGKKTLVVDTTTNQNLRLSVRNARYARAFEGRSQGSRAALHQESRCRMIAEHVIKRPIVLTEKSNRLKATANQVMFEVSRDANKVEIREAIQKLFNVKVEAVNTLNMRGKDRRMGRGYARMQNWKKAIVTLKAGENLDFFSEEGS
jgi:large subunit ribosomal protein L4